MLESSLRIALLTHSVNPRGGVVHTLELGGALQAAGHHVTIMAPAGGVQQLFRKTPCAVDLFDLSGPPDTVIDTIRARIDGYIDHLSASSASGPRYSQFDVLHAQDGIGGNALTTLREAGLIPGFVRTVHHVDQHADAQFNTWEERAIRGARSLCCVSRHWQQALMRSYGASSVVVNNGVDRSRYTPAPGVADMEVAERFGLRPEAPLIVSIGGVEERKNTLQTLRAFIRLRRQLPHAQWAIVGGASLLDHSSYQAQFSAVLKRSGLVDGLGGDIVRTGVVADADIPPLLRLAKVVAFSSVREGFGLVVLEALASGTPTVVSKIAPFTEYLDAADVHWADPHNAASIAAALAAAIQTKKFSPPAVCDRFSWQASAARQIEVYRNFLRTDSTPLH
jgi:glycosyltransferase-like protein